MGDVLQYQRFRNLVMEAIESYAITNQTDKDWIGEIIRADPMPKEAPCSS